MARFTVGADIGGTFTDIVVVDAAGAMRTRKVSSSVDDYAAAILTGIGEVFAESGENVDQVGEVLHGTTVASNAILERRGARVGLIGTKGFRDILEIRNLRMPRLYDLGWEKPPPLVERYRRAVVDERVAADGTVKQPLARAEAERAVAGLLAQDVEAIAVCLLNAYANPVHERLIAEVIGALAPGLPYCISYDVLPEIREYERTSTTVVNAYVMPIVSTYLASLRRALDDHGIAAPLLLMQSNGGLTTAEEAGRKPVNIVESGPAAGVVGAVRVAAEGGHGDIISFDMGGTTAKASLVEGGTIARSQDYSVGGGIMISSRLLTGGGYLLKVPAVDLAEVGAGGGSIVWIDDGGSIQIGPESAGAVPGPLCYDRGGTRPTVTDASVILGYLNPDYLVGGELPLNAARSRRLFADIIAAPLAIDLAEAAYGAYRIAISRMIRAIRAVSSERGRDPRAFTLFAFGGNGPLFAAGMAGELAMTKIVVPPAAGLFSAHGLLHADVEHHFSTTRRCLLRDADPAGLEDLWRALEDAARGQLAADGFAGAGIDCLRFASLRYHGQIYELSVPAPDRFTDKAAVDGLETAFGDEYARTYGHRAGADEAVELVNVQVRGRGIRGTLPATVGAAAGGDPPPPRRAYFGREIGWIETPVVSRSALATPCQGPCIVEEYDSTCLVPPGARAALDAGGNIVIDLP
jgi:N-methylhydantoinase A